MFIFQKEFFLNISFQILLKEFRFFGTFSIKVFFSNALHGLMNSILLQCLVVTLEGKNVCENGEKMSDRSKYELMRTEELFHSLAKICAVA